MTDYTPTTEQIRKGLLTGYVSDSEFDRWLGTIKDQAYREGWNEGYTDCLAFFGEETEEVTRALRFYKNVKRKAEQ